MQQQQTVIVTQAPPPVIVRPLPQKLKNFAKKQARFTGATQIVCGGLAIIFDIAGICIRDSYSNVGAGFWCGIFYIIAGGICVGAAKAKTECMIIGAMTMSIIANVFAFIQFCIACSGVSFSNHCTKSPYDSNCLQYSTSSSYGNSYFYLSYTYSQYVVGNYSGWLAIEVLQLIVSITEFVVSIWAAALCCQVVCCGRANVGTVIQPNNQSGVIVMQQQQQQQQPAYGYLQAGYPQPNAYVYGHPQVYGNQQFYGQPHGTPINPAYGSGPPGYNQGPQGYGQGPQMYGQVPQGYGQGPQMYGQAQQWHNQGPPVNAPQPPVNNQQPYGAVSDQPGAGPSMPPPYAQQPGQAPPAAAYQPPMTNEQQGVVNVTVNPAY